MIRILKGAVAALAGVVAVAVGALGLALFVVGVVLDWAPLRGPIESWASATFGRPVTIRGDLDVYPALRPWVSVWDVALANTEWGSEPSMLEAQRLTVEIDPLDLLRGGNGVRRLHLLRPSLLLELSADGRRNWDLGDPTDEGPPSVPVIPALAIQDGTITYRDPGLAGDLVTTDLDAEGVLASDSPVSLAGSGRLQGEPLELRLEAGPLADLNGGAENYPVELALRVGEGSLDVAGTLARPLELQGLELAVDLEQPDASVVHTVLDLPAGLDSYALQGRVNWDGANFAVSDLEARIGDSDLRGFARYGEGDNGRRQVIAANLTSGRLNLDQLRAVAEAVSGEPPAEPAPEAQGGDEQAADVTADAFTPDRLLERLDELRAVEADIAFAVGAIESQDLPVRAAEGRVLLKNGALTVEPLRLALPDQQLTATVHVDAGQDPVPVQAQLAVGETAASVSGALGRQPGATDFGLDISFRSPDPSVLTSLLGMPAADLPATAFEGRLGRDGEAWALSDFRAAVGASDLSGSVRLDRSGDKPAIAGELTATRLDVDELRHVADEVRALTGAGDGTAPADEAAAGEAGEADDGGVWETIASTAEAVRAVNADLRLAAETIEGDDLPIRGLAGHLRITDGVLNAEEARLDLPDGTTVTGTVRADASGAEIPLSVQANVGESSVQVEGTLTEATAIDAFRVTLNAEGQNLATLNAALQPFMDLSLPETPPYRIAGTVTREGDAWVFDNLRIAAGASDVIGSLRYEAGGERPFVTGSLTSSTLDVPEVLTIAGLRATPEGEVEEEEVTEEFVEEAAQVDGEEAPAQDRWVLPDVSLQHPVLREFDAEIDYRSTEVRGAGDLPIRELAVQLRLEGGVLAIEPLELEVGGGRLNTVLTLDASTDPTGIELDARIRGFDAQHLLAVFGEKIEEFAEGGSLSARVVLEAQGNALREALRSAAGDVAVVMEGGRLSALVIEAFGFDLGEALAVWFADRDEEKDKVGVRCVVGDFDLEGGVLRAETLVLDTTDTLIVGSGTIDLAAEQLNLTLEPRAKDASVLTAQTPIHLQGTFGDVEVNPDRESLVARGAAAVGLGVLIPVVGAVLPFIEPGLAEDSDCQALIEAAGQRPAGGDGGEATSSGG